MPARRRSCIVFDPTNYAQNVLTAARALQQINNQITSLQNQAQMLINQARNLASLPYSSLQQLAAVGRSAPSSFSPRRSASPTTSSRSTRPSRSNYRSVSLSASDQQLVADAHSRWQNTVGGLQDAMRVQAGVVGNLDTTRTQMSALVGAEPVARPARCRRRRPATSSSRSRRSSSPI